LTRQQGEEAPIIANRSLTEAAFGVHVYVSTSSMRRLSLQIGPRGAADRRQRETRGPRDEAGPSDSLHDGVLARRPRLQADRPEVRRTGDAVPRQPIAPSVSSSRSGTWNGRCLLHERPTRDESALHAAGLQAGAKRTLHKARAAQAGIEGGTLDRSTIGATVQVKMQMQRKAKWGRAITAA